MTEPADTQRLRQVNRLLAEALTLTDAQQQAWLAALRGDDAALAPLLRMLLRRAAVETDGFMRHPARHALREASDAGSADAPGDLVGPYRLLRVIGSGGMSEVWLAQRADGTLQREVALKLPHAVWLPGLGARMARERDILAALEHPHIARLYDAGATDAGRPYMAMEFVDGVPIDQHARERALTVEQRLRLFLQVLQAVAHAHARLIVHRDLKPSNILVTREGQVRLLDFGVAKLLSGEGLGDGGITQLAGRAYTPDYASPEQLGGGVLTVGTDVYSLGVVLYELLVGARPPRAHDAAGGTPQTSEYGADVPPASSAVVGDGRLSRRLRGDLDTVLAKALRASPAHRYASVESFAADLQRHLDGEPVLAQPRSVAYRMRKFVARHRLALLSAGAAAGALLLASGIALWQAREAQQQARSARASLVQADAAVDFMMRVLSEGVQGGEAITLDELVLRSETLAEALPATNGIERAMAVDSVAALYISYGNYERAYRLLERSLATLPPDVDTVLSSTLRCKLGHALAGLGRADEAVREIESGLAAAQQRPATASYCHHLRSRVARSINDAPGALLHIERAQQLASDAGRRSARGTALLVADHAYALSLNGQTAAALRRYAAAAALFADAGSSESVPAVSVYNNWAIAMLSAGDPAGALQQLDRSAAISARRSPFRTAPAFVHVNRGVALRALARYDETLEALEQALQSARREASPQFIVYALAAQSQTLLEAGRVEAARESLQRAQAEAAQVAVPPDSPTGLVLLGAEAALAQRDGRLRDAETMLKEVQQRHRRRQLKGGTMALAPLHRSEVASQEGRLDDALQFAEEAVAIARLAQGELPASSLSGQALLTLARVHRARGELDPARVAAQDAQRQLVARVGAMHPLARQADALLIELGR